MSSSVVSASLTVFQSTLPTRGSDTTRTPSRPTSEHFNPRSPRGGATLRLRRCRCHGRNFNPRSPRGGATKAIHLRDVGFLISIHAPHEGERRSSCSTSLTASSISIHAPHEGERRCLCHAPCEGAHLFQSTLPTRGSDPNITIIDGVWNKFQSTLPTRGSDSYFSMRARQSPWISIHAPHEGERQRKSAFVCSISANLLNIIHCGAVTRAVSRRRIALFRLFSVRRSGVFMYAYASH